MKKEKQVLQGITVTGKSVYVLLGRGCVGTGVTGNRVSLITLTTKGKVGSNTNPDSEGDENIIIDFENEAGLNVLMDALKEVKKSFKRKRK